MSQSKVWAIVILGILVLGAGMYLNLPVNNKTISPLEAPATSYLPDYFEGKPAVQITWDYGAAPYFNIYRSVDGQNWQIFAAKFPQSAHAAVDTDLPKDAKTLYYRVSPLDENGTEGVSSPVSAVVIPNQISQIETSDWKTYTNTEFGFEVTVPPSWAGYKVERRLIPTTNWSIDGAPDVVSFSFSLKDGDRDYKVFSVTVFPKTIWDQIYEYNGVLGGKYLGEQNGFVFTKGGAQESPINLSYNKITQEGFKILSSFKFTHPTVDRITRADWELTFLKSSDWEITTNSMGSEGEVVLTKKSGESKGDRITISHVTASTITDTDAKFGDITYFFDKKLESWMKVGAENQTPKPKKATSLELDMVGGLYSLDGFPIFAGTRRWRTYIIPLSSNSILKLNIIGSGYTEALDELVKTIKKID